MKTKTNACPAAGTTEQAIKTESFASKHDSTFDITTNDANSQEFYIFDMLPKGEANAIPRRELRRITGMADRDLLREIEQERKNGVLILSKYDAAGGYFKPSDGAVGMEEVKRFYNTMRKRAIKTLTVVKHARKYIVKGGAENE